MAGEPRLLLAGAVLAGASAGFLAFNWSPARVFMGDVGATFLGAALASMPWVTPEPSRWMMPAVVVLAPFWVDAGVTLLMRILRGDVLYQGHQEHFYQRLVGAGLRHSTVALGYGVMTAIGGGAAVALARLDHARSPVMTGLVLAAAAGLMGLCAGVMRRAASHSGRAPGLHDAARRPRRRDRRHHGIAQAAPVSRRARRRVTTVSRNGPPSTSRVTRSATPVSV